MQLVHQLIEFIRNPAYLAELGYPVLALVIFIETGAMIFFLPGDSLLVTAGVYAASGKLDLLLLNVLLIPCAILGDALSYYLGTKSGPVLFNRPRSRIFRPEHVTAAHAFYEKHGGKAIVIARFMPVMRTFVPVIAGIAQMQYRRFAMWNILGGVSWVFSMLMIGFFVGKTPLGKHVEGVIVVIIVLSVLPGFIAWFRSRKSSRPDAEASN
ncbi:MAG TPA: VTT domain-containing protein [Polyangiales bacterium]|jgi:membrane-associated protein|nr:VTT domain-containing protein [Polyangiales bacterium]